MTANAGRQARLPQLAWWAFALLPWLVLTARHWGWNADAAHGDHAQYVLHALALLDGRSYGDIGYLYHPEVWWIGPTAFPPGFPLTLAPIIAVAGRGPAVFHLLNVVFVLVFAWAVSRALPRDVPSWQRALAMGLTVLAMEQSGALSVPLSDPGFCALLWLTVAAVDFAPAWSAARVAMVTALGGAAMAYRAPGVVLVPSLALFGAMHWQRWRGRPWLPVVAWSLAGAAAVGIGVVSLPYRDVLGFTLWTGVHRWRLAWDAVRYACLELMGYPLPGNLPNDVWHLVGMVAMAWGGFLLVRRHRLTFAGVVMAAYAAMLVVSPVASTRYYWPLYPVMALALVVGLESAVQRVRAGATGTLAPLMLGAVLFGVMLRGWQQPPPLSITGDPAGQEMFQWFRSAARDRPIRVAYQKPRLLTLQTGVPAMGFADRTTEGHIEILRSREITHVVVPIGPQADCVSMLVEQLATRHQSWMTRVWENSGYRIYALNASTPPVAGEWELIDWEHAERYCPLAAAR